VVVVIIIGWYWQRSFMRVSSFRGSIEEREVVATVGRKEE